MAGELSVDPRSHREDRRARPRRRPADDATSSRSRTRCAPTSRGPCLPREVALDAGARRGQDGGFLRPEPAGRHDGRQRAHRPHGRAGGRRDRRAATSTAASCSRPTATAPRPTSSTRYLWVADEPPEDLHTDGAAARRPARRQGPLLHRGRARARPARGSSRATGRRTPRPSVAPPGAGRRAAARQDQPGRVRDGLVERELRLRAGAQPVGPHARAGRLVGRQRRRRRRGHRAVGARHRHRRLDPPARRAVRDRRPQAHLRRGQPLRDDRLRLVARPGRPVHARRHRRRAALPPHDRPRRPRLDRRSPSPRRSRCPTAAAPRRDPPRRPGRAAPARASSPACMERFEATLAVARGPRRDRRARRAAARRLRPQRLLRARPGRGVVEPRALRRRALRPAPRRPTTC